jgi:hypothetical protein
MTVCADHSCAMSAPRSTQPTDTCLQHTVGRHSAHMLVSTTVLRVFNHNCSKCAGVAPRAKAAQAV